MATPPFLPDETKPGASNLISLYPAVEHTFREIIESWLLIEHNTNGTHKQVTLDDISEPTIAADLVGLWHESGVLKTRFATGDVFDVFTTAGGTLTGALILAGNPSDALGATTKQQTDLKANLASPALTGNPTAPTQSTGNDSTRIATTAFVQAKSPFSKAFESSVQTITSAGLLTLAHSLGAAPTLVQAFIKNTSTEHGYSANDITAVASGYNANDSADRGISTVIDSTNIKIRFGANGQTFQILNKSTGIRASITNSKWKLIIRAWV